MREGLQEASYTIGELVALRHEDECDSARIREEHDANADDESAEEARRRSGR
jgi:hypothetical protein